MQTDTERIVEEALRLTTIDRARLADQLVDSLDGSAFTEIDGLWANQARRRRDEVRSGEVEPIPGEEALRRVREELGR